MLRRIIRRGIRFARKLGVQGPFLAKVAEPVIQHMGPKYPELEEHRRFVLRALELEEERFQQAIDLGLPLLEQELVPFHHSIANTGGTGDSLTELSERIPLGVREKVAALMSEPAGRSWLEQAISGPEAFLLYDTHGFPLELTQEIAREHGLEVDLEGFEAEMEAQRQRGRAAGHKFGGGRDLHRTYEALGVDATDFLGYDTLEAESVVVGLLADGSPVQQAGQGQRVEVVLRETPFHPEGGGQVGDTGTIESAGGRLRVGDTQRPVAELIVHRRHGGGGRYLGGR